MTGVLRRARVSGKPVVGLDVRPGTAIASLAAQYGFVSTQRRRFDRQTYLHLRYRRP